MFLKAGYSFRKPQKHFLVNRKNPFCPDLLFINNAGGGQCIEYFSNETSFNRVGLPSWAIDQSNMTARFSPTQDYTYDSLLGIVDFPLTICARFKRQGNGAGIVFDIAESASGSVNCGLGIDSGNRAYLFMRGHGGATMIGATVLNTTDYYNVTAVVTQGFQAGETSRLFVNGIEEDNANSSSNITAGSDRITLGMLGDSSPSWGFNGFVDYVLVYKRDLHKEGLIEELHNNGPFSFIDPVRTLISIPSGPVGNILTFNKTYERRLLNDVIYSKQYLRNILTDTTFTKLYPRRILGDLQTNKTYSRRLLNDLTVSKTYIRRIIGDITFNKTYIRNIGQNVVEFVKEYQRRILSSAEIQKTYARRILNDTVFSKTYPRRILNSITKSTTYIRAIIGATVTTFTKTYSRRLLNDTEITKTYPRRIMSDLIDTRLYFRRILNDLTKTTTYARRIKDAIIFIRTYARQIISDVLAEDIIDADIVPRIAETNIIARIPRTTIVAIPEG